MKKWIRRHAFLPLCVTIALNCFTFYATRPITAGWHHWDFTTALDVATPLVTQAIYIYVLAFLSWLTGFCLVGRQESELCHELLAGENIAKLLCLVLFLAVPTVMVRPEITGNTPSAWLLRLIYSLDQPNNLLPSIHCVENWFLFRATLRCKGIGKWGRLGYFLFALLVFASTLLVKQHVVVDVIAAVVVVELGLRLSKVLRAGRVYGALNRRFRMT